MSADGEGPETDGRSFEAMLARLEEIADRLEVEPLELDDSLALFEEGVVLLREAERTLSSAEARVHRLLEDDSLAPWTET